MLAIGVLHTRKYVLGGDFSSNKFLMFMRYVSPKLVGLLYGVGEDAPLMPFRSPVVEIKLLVTTVCAFFFPNLLTFLDDFSLFTFPNSSFRFRFLYLKIPQVISGVRYSCDSPSLSGKNRFLIGVTIFTYFLDFDFPFAHFLTVFQFKWHSTFGFVIYIHKQLSSKLIKRAL